VLLNFRGALSPLAGRGRINICCGLEI